MFCHCLVVDLGMIGVKCESLGFDLRRSGF